MNHLEELRNTALETVGFERFSDFFTDSTIKNEKGYSTRDRFIDIITDPSNLLIPRVENAGTEYGDFAIMHNGIKVKKGEYYGDFFDIIYFNKGCHEPSEERMFSTVLPFIPEGGVMIELGSYWAFYSLWFHSKIKNAMNYCIEPSLSSLEVGKENFRINGFTADFTQGFIGANEENIKLTEFIKEKNITFIDILHSDIQGYEYDMLIDIIPLLDNKMIRYLFISTHSDELHLKCTKILEDHHYKIIASADFETESFCFDGIIVACHESTKDLPFISLGSRKYTKLRTHPY
jgi:hypothetical protein